MAVSVPESASPGLGAKSIQIEFLLKKTVLAEQNALLAGFGLWASYPSLITNMSTATYKNLN